jgi:CBS domain-containing protein
MATKKIGCVPVVSDGNLVGLLTTTDILRYVESLG